MVIFRGVPHLNAHGVCILHRDSRINPQSGLYGGLSGALLATLWAIQCLCCRDWGFTAASPVLCWLYSDDTGLDKPAIGPIRVPLRCIAGYTSINTMPCWPPLGLYCPSVNHTIVIIVGTVGLLCYGWRVGYAYAESH